MDKQVLIQQNRGLGDIFFLQKIAHKLIDHGYTCYWPVIDQYSWIADYIQRKGLNFTNTSCDIRIDFQHAIESNHPYDIMTCKYLMLQRSNHEFPEEIREINWRDWADYFLFNRNIKKENCLFYDVLNLRDGEKYVLVNEHFGDNQTSGQIRNYIQNKNLRLVELNILNEFTLFDWCKVFENAVEIDTIDTSILYICQVLNLKAEIFNILPRHPEHTKKCLEKLFNKKWNWM